MSNVEFNILVGKRLLGYMPLSESDRKKVKGDFDNAIILFIGHANDISECYVVRSENQDYKMYDRWIIEPILGVPQRDDTYKAIGESIESVVDISQREDIKSKWSSEDDIYWMEIRTATKVIRLGHHWNDCHYPNSIWEVTGSNTHLPIYKPPTCQRCREELSDNHDCLEILTRKMREYEVEWPEPLYEPHPDLQELLKMIDGECEEHHGTRPCRGCGHDIGWVKARTIALMNELTELRKNSRK